MSPMLKFDELNEQVTAHAHISLLFDRILSGFELWIRMFGQELVYGPDHGSIRERAFVLERRVPRGFQLGHCRSRPNDPEFFGSRLACKRIPVRLHSLVRVQFGRAFVRGRRRINYCEGHIGLFRCAFIEHVEVTRLRTRDIEPKFVAIFEYLLP